MLLCSESSQLPYRFPGVKTAITQLFNQRSFRSTIEDECCNRSLRPEDVKPCIETLYHLLSKHAHGNTQDIIVDRNNYTVAEVAGIVSVLRYLDNEDALGVKWSEVDSTPVSTNS